MYSDKACIYRYHIGTLFYFGLYNTVYSDIYGLNATREAWLAVKGGITVAEFTGFVSLLSSLAAPSISLGSFYRVAAARPWSLKST